MNTSLKVFNSCLWYLDSGCSHHMTGDKSLFKSLKEKVGDYVTFGDYTGITSIKGCLIHQRA